jgi:hypothetical protein
VYLSRVLGANATSLGVGMLVAGVAFGVVCDRVSPAAVASPLLVVRLPNLHQRVATAKS